MITVRKRNEGSESLRDVHTSVLSETFEAALHNGSFTETQVSEKQPRANLEEEESGRRPIYAKASEENKLGFSLELQMDGLDHIK